MQVYVCVWFCVFIFCLCFCYVCISCVCVFSIWIKISLWVIKGCVCVYLCCVKVVHVCLRELFVFVQCVYVIVPQLKGFWFWILGQKTDRVDNFWQTCYWILAPIPSVKDTTNKADQLAIGAEHGSLFSSQASSKSMVSQR